MMNEEMGLSPNHKNYLKKFRSKLQDILTPDHTDAELIKWLIGNNFDLKKAERMFREVDSCRKIMGFNTITDTYTLPEAFKIYNRTAFLGFAKDGSAIRYYCVHTDLLGLAYSYSLSEVLTFLVYIVESDLKKVKEQNEKTGQNNTKITYILDFGEFSYSELFHTAELLMRSVWYMYLFKSVGVFYDLAVLYQRWKFFLPQRVLINAGLELFSKFQEHYPESWSKFLLINAPYLIDKIIMLFKPVFKSTFLDYFYIAMKSSTSTLLKKYIDDDVVPGFLGGTRVDSTGDPKCREIINDYRKVPEEYYLKNTRHFMDETDPGVKVAILRPWSFYNIPVIAKEAGTKMRIELRSDDGGLTLSVLHRHFSSDSEAIELPEWNEKLDPEDESSNIRVVIPKITSHICPEDFMTNAHWSGIYIIRFENSSNWFASRKVYYRITAFPPDS